MTAIHLDLHRILTTVVVVISPVLCRYKVLITAASFLDFHGILTTVVVTCLVLFRYNLLITAVQVQFVITAKSLNLHVILTTVVGTCLVLFKYNMLITAVQLQFADNGQSLNLHVILTTVVVTCLVLFRYSLLVTAKSLNLHVILTTVVVTCPVLFRYNVLMTAKRAGLLLVTAWSIAVASSFVPITNGWHNHEHNSLTNLTTNGPIPQCVLRVSLPYALTASFVTIFLPIIIAFVLYCRVSEEAKRQAVFVRSLIAPSRVLLGQELTNNSIREPFTRKATVTLGVIVGAYVFTWTPFLITNVVDAQCKCVPPKVFGAFVWLGYCNSLMNPIIYPLLMRDFRKVYISNLKACCPGFAFAFFRKSSKNSGVKDTPVDSTYEHTHSVMDKSLKNSVCDNPNKIVNGVDKGEKQNVVENGEKDCAACKRGSEFNV